MKSPKNVFRICWENKEIDELGKESYNDFYNNVIDSYRTSKSGLSKEIKWKAQHRTTNIKTTVRLKWHNKIQDFIDP